jgi:hypothetical protein
MSRAASVTAGAATGERSVVPADIGSKSASGRAPIAALLGALVAIAALAAAQLNVVGGWHLAAPNAIAGTTDATPMPASLRVAVSTSLGRVDRRFWPVAHGSSLRTRGGSIDGDFTAAAARLSTAHGTLGLTLLGVGRGQQVGPLAAATPSASANQVVYRHGPVAEYYRNGPYGLEQGFNVTRRPQGSGELALTLRVSGSLTAHLAGSRVLFDTPRGSAVFSYGQLSALDADGRQLPAVIRLHHGSLRLQIDDAGARYPLRIDPFIQQGSKLTGVAELGEEAARFGTSVSLSADGDTALVGAPDFDGSGSTEHFDTGIAFVFARSGSTWEQQGPALRGAELREKHGAEFGASVALSAGGYTALIGAPSRVDKGGERIGAAWVFVRKGSSWHQQGKALIGKNMVGRTLFGSSVSLSADGDTALIGGEGDGGGERIGAAWVFTRSGSTWTQDGEKLKGAGEVDAAHFGRYVVLSRDGEMALIAGPEDFNGAGAVWTFTRSGSTWTQDGEKLTGGSFPNPEERSAQFGSGLALSADGDEALIGSRLTWQDHHALAAGTVFTRTESGWVQQGAPLFGLDQQQLNTYGARGVALSADGSTAIVAAPNTLVGAWVFTRLGSTWTQQGETLAGPSNGVALSSLGTALIGSAGEEHARGAVFAYEHVQLGCTDSWTNTAGGDWFTGSDWSLGRPPGPEDEACVTAPGTYTVSMDQTETTGTVSVRSLTVGAGSGTQTLAVAGTCTQNAVLSSALGVTNGRHGAIELTNDDSCASDVTVKGPLANQGLLAAEEAGGGTRTVEGDLTNNGTVSLAAGEQLHVVGYQQTSLGRLKTFIAGSSSFGSLTVERGLVIAGVLVVQQVHPFKAVSGDEFQIIGKAAWQIGSFQTLNGMQTSFFPAAYYRPEYFVERQGKENRFALTYAKVEAKLSPKSGAPAGIVTISGSGFLPGETITPTFTDHEGVVTSYPGVTAAKGGAFSASIEIPAAAALGEGTVSVTSSGTGVKVNRSFTVS